MRYFDAHAFLGFRGGGPEVRSKDDVGRVAQRIGRVGRLLLEDVDRRAGDVAGGKGFGQRLLVDQPAARAVDNAGALFEEGETLGVEHVAGFVGQRHVHGDEIGLREGVLEVFDQFDLQGFGARRGEVGVISEHAHPEGEGAFGHFGADAAHAKDGQCLAVEFDALKTFTIPLAGLHAGIGLRNLAGDGNEEGKGVFRSGDRVSARGVHHDDAALRGGVDVHIVHPDPGAADGFKVFRRGDDVSPDLGLAADDKGGKFRDNFEQFLVRQTG